MKTEVTIIIPAYNEGKSIGKVIDQVKDTMSHAGVSHEIVVVDDGSTDGTTAAIVNEKGVKLIQHPYNKGYGAALKTGVRNAEGEIVLFIDGDEQQKPGDIPGLLEFMDKYDMVIGWRTGASKIPIFRKLGKLILGSLANYLAGWKIPDLNSGFRAIKKEIVLKYMAILPDTFSFTTTITLAAIKEGYNLKYVPIETGERVGSSKIKFFRDGFRFVMLILRMIVLFEPMKVFLPVSLVLFLGGFGYLVYNLIIALNVPDTSILLIVSSLIVFFFGLLADQISLILMKKKE
ncbi:MAG: glycosyltransferase family 2 protein [Dehalococcoidales bacterium]|nr:glycosyltransferase family 2 protein [Dehalococcoidales bacterium]